MEETYKKKQKSSEELFRRTPEGLVASRREVTKYIPSMMFLNAMLSI